MKKILLPTKKYESFLKVFLPNKEKFNADLNLKFKKYEDQPFDYVESLLGEIQKHKINNLKKLHKYLANNNKSEELTQLKSFSTKELEDLIKLASKDEEKFAIEYSKWKEFKEASKNFEANYIIDPNIDDLTLMIKDKNNTKENSERNLFIYFSGTSNCPLAHEKNIMRNVNFMGNILKENNHNLFSINKDSMDFSILNESINGKNFKEDIANKVKTMKYFLAQGYKTENIILIGNCMGNAKLSETINQLQKDLGEEYKKFNSCLYINSFVKVSDLINNMFNSEKKITKAFSKIIKFLYNKIIPDEIKKRYDLDSSILVHNKSFVERQVIINIENDYLIKPELLLSKKCIDEKITDIEFFQYPQSDVWGHNNCDYVCMSAFLFENIEENKKIEESNNLINKKNFLAA